MIIYYFYFQKNEITVHDIYILGNVDGFAAVCTLYTEEESNSQYFGAKANYMV